MFRQSPRRNGRNKGLKIKHVLQISVLLGVSVWLLYQLHHSDDKKATTVKTNIFEKARNDSSKESVRLGRKDLRPKDKEKKETEDENEDDVGENEQKPEEGGREKKAKAQVYNTNDYINGKVKKNTSNEQNQVVVTEKEVKPKKKDVKKMKVNPKKAEMPSLSSEEEEEDDDQSVTDDVENTPQENNGEKRRKKSTSSRKGPNHDQHNTSSSKIDRPGVGNQIDTKDSNKQTEKQQQINKNPDSHSVPSFEPKIANSTNPTDNDYDLEAEESNELASSNKNENENENAADESEQTIEKDGESILDEETDALTDLGTLPESETGGSISHDDAATE